MIEDTWGTEHWPDHVHAYLISVTSMNKRKDAQHWKKYGLSIPDLSFRCEFAFELIHDTLYGNKTESVYAVRIMCPRVDHHKLRKIQNYRRKWIGCSWSKVKIK